MDKIIIKGLSISAKHGVNPEEKVNDQLFVVDCRVYLKNKHPFSSDDVSQTINYSHVCRKIKETVENNSFNLIEKLAEEISKNLFDVFKDIHRLKVTVKKPNAPINFVKFKYVGVEIERRRADYNA